MPFPEESLKDEEPIDFSNVEMERFSETEKGSYLLMPTAELLDQILDRMSTVNVVVSKKKLRFQCRNVKNLMRVSVFCM